MISDRDHVDVERLSELADESLAAPERARVQSHLAHCAECARRLASLRHLLAAASALPGEVQPPIELWPAIRDRIAATETGAATGRASPHLSWFVRRPWLLAAAAVVLIALSSLITATLVKQPPSRGVASTPAPASVILPAAARGVDAEYARTARELTEALAAQRPQLDPATIAKVEASLRVIDEAIDEARRALAGDPANRTLLDILSANYEHKLELLRRATELPSST